ncbi:hypothetical protein T459_12879 [Capsicum annuum]|uniref:Uncharacterized protein n=1 Tax=Capsicum annuum TaxID=4072 RepID=A0A2G2ZR19_CAPAN|nr:hypothetical protein T459_12879 [Capsicum annuum]
MDDQLHAIDTRGVEDRFGCTECRCHLYNVAKDENGRDIGPDYFGGLKCSPNKTRCRLREGFKGPKKAYYMKYSVSMLIGMRPPLCLSRFIFSMSQIHGGESLETETALVKHQCQIEYAVEPCSADENVGGCTHARNITVPFPIDGDVITYGVAHHHRGGMRSTLHGEDERVICSSKPICGKGKSGK